MAAWTMVNNVWRQQWAPYTMVDGVWRPNNITVPINGVMRDVYQYYIEEKDIIGFRMVYKRSSTKKHPEFPNLKPNPTLPVITGLTGNGAGSMNLSPKGIVLEYSRDDPYNEGIYVYEGLLYGVLTNGAIVNITGTTEEIANDDRGEGYAPDMWATFGTHRISKLSVSLTAYKTYEQSGHYMNGWNRLFDDEDFLDRSSYEDNKLHEASTEIITLNLLPISSRSENFRPVAVIGIARDVKSFETNMVGSHGNLDQTINKVMVNGVQKPFVVEFYD